MSRAAPSPLQITEAAAWEPLCFTVPIPVSTNNAYATVRGRRVKTKAARAYADEVAIWALLALLKHQSTMPAAPHGYAVSLRFWFKDRRRRDLDNGLKILLDAATTGLGFDDSQITELHVTRGVDWRNPRCEVEIAATRTAGRDEQGGAEG